MAKILRRIDGTGVLNKDGNKARGKDGTSKSNYKKNFSGNQSPKREDGKPNKGQKEQEKEAYDSRGHQYRRNFKGTNGNHQPRERKTRAFNYKMNQNSDSEWEDINSEKQITKSSEEEDSSSEAEEYEMNFIEESKGKDSPIIEVLANKRPVRALLDTGAQLSVISKALLASLREKEDVRILPVSNVIIKGVCNNQRKIKVRVQLNIKIKDRCVSWIFLVVPWRNNEMIIGIDLLKEVKARIDITDQSVIIKGTKIDFIQEKLLYQIEAKLEEDIRKLVGEFPKVFNEEIEGINAEKVKINMVDKRPHKRPMNPISVIHMPQTRTYKKEIDKINVRVALEKAQLAKEEFNEEERKERHAWRCQQKRESKARRKKERKKRKRKKKRKSKDTKQW